MSRPHVIKEKDWWKEGFSVHDLVTDSDLYFDTSMAEKEIGAIVGFLKDVFGFSPIAALDICCGAARHVSALQKYVSYVVGLDYSFDLLKAGMERDNSYEVTLITFPYDRNHLTWLRAWAIQWDMAREAMTVCLLQKPQGFPRKAAMSQ